MLAHAVVNHASPPLKTDNPSTVSVGRIQSLDLLKVVAIFGVIVFHTYPFLGVNWELYKLTRNAWGFAVPVFFIISGYLFNLKSGSEAKLTSRYLLSVKRLFLILVVWSFIYASIPAREALRSEGLTGAIVAGWRSEISNLIQDPVRILSEGLRVHLWFIVSLIVALTIAYPFIRKKLYRELAIVAAGLYVIGLLGGAYAGMPLGIDMSYNTRDGPFQATLFVTIGVLLASRDSRPSLRQALMLLFGGLLLHLAEAGFLLKYMVREDIRAEYYLGTIPFATGLMLLALAKPDLGRLTALSKLAPYVLGVYVTHYMVVTYALPFSIGIHNIAWQLIYAPVVFFISLLLTLGLAQIPFFRKVVTTS